MIASAVYAQPEGASPMKNGEPFRERVQQASGSIESIQSMFNQEKHLAVLAEPAKSAGNFFYSDTGFIRWEYATPTQQSIIINNGDVVLINEGVRERTNARTAKAYQQMNIMIAEVIHGDVFGDKRFEYQFYEVDNFSGLVVMKPNESAITAHLQSVELYFNDDHQVEQLQLNEPGGDYTRYVFYDQVYNEKLPEAAYVPKPMP